MWNGVAYVDIDVFGQVQVGQNILINCKMPIRIYPQSG